MGMTIDEIIQGIQVIKAQAEWVYPLDWQIVLDGAIETMRKYQKIVQIYQKWNRNYDIQISSAWTEVIEVLEDGRNLPSETPQLLSGLDKNSEKLELQEPKPMVEIDLYSVIKQKYIEREVLDKIRAEIVELQKEYQEYGWAYDDVLEIIDKYKAETEE